MKFAPYTSGRLKELKVGITSYSEGKTSLNITGNVGIGTDIPTNEVGAANTSILAVGILTAYKLYSTVFGEFTGGSVLADSIVGSALSISGISTIGDVNARTLNISGLSTFAGNINANGNIIGDNSTNISGISSVTATSFFGNLTGNVTGNADTATNATTATVATNISTIDESSDNENFVVFTNNATGNQTPRTGSNLTFNASNGQLNATTFFGNLTGTVNTSAQPNITSLGTLSSLNVSGNVSIGGTLTYEDVTNIDSIGLITARSGIKDQTLTAGRVVYVDSDKTLTDSANLIFDGNNLGIGTDIPTNQVGASNTSIIAVGILTANRIFSTVFGEFTGGTVTGDAIVGTALSISGISTIGDANARTINVSGVSTFTGNIDANSNLDVAGVSTFADNINFLGSPAGIAQTSIQFYKGDGSNYNLDALNLYDNAAINVGKGHTGSIQLRGNWNSTGASPTFGSYILATGDHFFIDGGQSTAIKIRTQFARNAIIANSDNGGSGTVELYHSSGGTATKKFETSGLGVTVYGTVDATQLNASGIITSTGADINGDLDVDGHTNLDNVSIAGFTTITQDLDVDGHTNLDNISVAGVSTFTGDATFSGNVSIGGTLTYEDVTNVDSVGLLTARSGIRVTGGVIEAQAGENKIPSLYANLAALPNASTYHGMFAHVHSTGRGYFAHAGNWFELVNKESDGTVGTGTERYNIGPVDLTSLDVSGISTLGSGGSGQVFLQHGGSTKLQTQTWGVRAQGTIQAIGGRVETAHTGSQTESYSLKLLNSDGAGGVKDLIEIGHSSNNSFITGHVGNININAPIVAISTSMTVGSAVTANSSGIDVTGIVTATSFVGDGSNLTGIAAGGFEPDADENLIAGTQAGIAITPASTSACYNILVGSCAGKDLNSGDNNVLIGVGVGKSLNTQSSNVYIGECVATDSISGNYNFASGTGAARCVSGSNNIIMGCCAASVNKVNSSHNVILGSNAGKCMSGNSGENIIIGKNAGFEHGNGTNNVILGQNAAYSIGNGGNNFIVGNNAAYNIGNGSNNIIFGSNAGKCLNNGGNHVIFGVSAGQNLNNAGNNILVGSNSGKCLTNNGENIYLGSSSGKCSTAGTNIAIGKNAYCGSSTGSKNIILGELAGRCLTSGSCNLLIGVGAGCLLTTGHNNIMMGCCVNAPSATDNCQLAIGHGTDYWITGNSDFNVGIGTTNPSSRLSVVGGVFVSGILTATNIKAESNLTVDGGNLTLLNGDLYVNDQIIHYNDTDTSIQFDEDTIIFETGGSERLRIGSLGQIGLSGTNYGTSGQVLTSNGSSSAPSWQAVSGGGFDPDAQENLYAGTNAGASSDADTCFNVAIGYSAGVNNSAGDHNVFLGTNSGNDTTIGSFNFFGGYKAAKGNIGGACNVYIGNQVGYAATGGEQNIALGQKAAYNNSTGSYNIFFGSCAGYCSSSGLHNVVLGLRAGAKITSGSCNVFLGFDAGCCATGSLRNVYIGTNAGKTVCGGAHDIALGSDNLCESKRACNNIAIGKNVFVKMNCDGNSNGLFNIGIGAQVGTGATVGGYNLLLGYQAGTTFVCGSDNIILGKQAGRCSSNSTKNILIGCQAGRSVVTAGCAGQANIAIGNLAGAQISSTSDRNIFIGNRAGSEATGGCFNIALGADAGNYVTGNDNVFIGQYAGFTHTISGNSNVVIGKQVCLPSASGSTQLAIGAGATSWISGDSSFNVGIGTTNPQAKLDVIGNIIIQNTYPSIFLTDTDSNDDFSIQNQNGVFAVRDETNSENRLNIDSTGKVGIGTANPARDFHVVGTSRFEQLDVVGFATFGSAGTKFFHHVPRIEMQGSNTAQIQLTNATAGTNITDGMVMGFSSSSAAGFINVYEGGHGFILKTGGTGTTSNRLVVSGLGTISLRKGTEEMIKAIPDGAVELYHNNVKKFETSSSGAIVTGILTATSFEGDGSNLTNLPGITTSSDPSFSQVEWDVVNNGASSYRFTGPGNDGAEDNPDIYLVRGQKYTFDVNASGHPFKIRVSSGGSDYSDGVINNGAETGKVIINVQHDAPAQLVYQCQYHGGMVGNIYIVGQHLANGANNRLVTATSAYGLTGETDLTYDGTYLQMIGSGYKQLTVSTSTANSVSFKLQNQTKNFTVTNVTGGKFQISEAGTPRFEIENGLITMPGNVSIGGTLTYEDVTNVDSIGIITAREGIFIPDDKKLELGNAAGSGDLSIFYDSTPGESLISHTGPGVFKIEGNSSNNIFIRPKSGENSITAKPDAEVELFYNNVLRFETTSSGAIVTGVLTATSFEGDGSNLTNLPGISTSSDPSFSQVEWDVVNNGASSYRFTGPGNDGAEDNPDLYLVRGQKYTFNVNASGHPFKIRVSNGGSDYSDGVINNGAQSGKVILNVQHDAPAQLFYQCQYHSGMVGNIYIVGGEQIITGILTATSLSIDDYIYHNGDTNTFIGFESNDTIRFNTNGSDKFKINSSGYLILADDNDTYIHHPASDTIAVTVGSNERLRVNSSGITVTGTVAATSYTGDGSSLTGITTTGDIIDVTGITTTSGTFNVSAGVSTNIDSFAYASADYKTAEYTLHFMNGSDIQAQKLLVMRNGTTAFSEEYGVMSSSGLLVSVGATVSSGNVLIQATPETGVSGVTTYRWRREVQL